MAAINDAIPDVTTTLIDLTAVTVTSESAEITPLIVRARTGVALIVLAFGMVTTTALSTVAAATI
jgi:hypothetical protein